MTSERTAPADDLFRDLVGQWVAHVSCGHSLGEIIVKSDAQIAEDSDDTPHSRVVFNGISHFEWDRRGSRPTPIAPGRRETVEGRLDTAERHGDSWRLVGEFGEFAITAERAFRNDYEPRLRDPVPLPTLDVELPHACESMVRCVADDENAIEYLSAYREYGYLKTTERGFVVDGTFHIIQFCPFCGAELPPSLFDQWAQRAAELGLDEDSPDEELPVELRSDEWWRAAGL